MAYEVLAANTYLGLALFFDVEQNTMSFQAVSLYTKTVFQQSDEPNAISKYLVTVFRVHE